MITPKQKAKELYNKMYAINEDDFISEYASKATALIAVEEILEATKKYVAVVETVPYSKTGVDFVVNTEYDNFWLEVKQEIQKII